MVKIRAFRAVDDPESAQRFIDGHRRVLEIHGVKKVTSANHDWMYNPAVYVINVENTDGTKIYGGSRVHCAGGTQPLPIEEATGFMDERIHTMVKNLMPRGTGELCGLWNSIEVAGLGIGSFFATRAGVTLSHMIGLESLWALCAPYTVKWAERVGCRVVKELGNNGTFYYPKLDLVATAVLLEDTGPLSHARPSEQKRMWDLRQNPIQTAMEVSPGKRMEVEVQYDLLIPNVNLDEFKIIPE